LLTKQCEAQRATAAAATTAARGGRAGDKLTPAEAAADKRGTFVYGFCFFFFVCVVSSIDLFVCLFVCLFCLFVC
jgi:hypothetical protein